MLCWQNLHTKELGRLVIFGEVMTSSMRLLTDPISKHGLVIIAKQQVSGIGKTFFFFLVIIFSNGI